MIGYLVYFIYAKSGDYVTSEYNSSRQSIYEDIYLRGSILSSDGEVLAYTSVDSEGNETRVYPYGSVFAHIVGYSTRGSTGVESLAGTYLLSSSISPIQIAINQFQDIKTEGDTVVTTLDTRLQQAAYDALGDYEGAVVALDPETGEILAMVSKPDFNPNEINEIWDELTDEDSSNSNLVNRATQGLYPPGSTFKILTALEYIREYPTSYSSYSYYCSSTYTSGSYSISCYHNTSHGTVSLADAFAESCNGAFADIGLKLDFSSFYDLCEDFGFNEDLPVDLTSNASSFVLSDNSSTWDVLQTSIGQGSTVVTPLHMAMIVSAIANDGVMMKPYVLNYVESAEGEVVETWSSEEYRTVMTSEEAEILNELMRGVVTDGTGSSAQGSGYTVAGKTGSAEWSTDEETHAWFVGFANADDPDIVVCVIVESGGSGGSVAAPIARKVFDAYYTYCTTD